MAKRPPKSLPAIYHENAQHIMEVDAKILKRHYTEREAYLRYRANPEAFVERYLPKISVGPGEQGEHIVRVIHAIPTSPLDAIDVTPTGNIIETLPITQREESE